MNKLIIILVCTVGLCYPQNVYDVLRPYFGFNSSQILINSIGGATVAAGNVIPGATSNPANLAMHRFKQIQSNFSNSRFNSNTENNSATNFNGFHFTYPIPVFQGSLVIGGGVNKEIDYMSASRTDIFKYSEVGGLNIWRIGAAVEYSKKLYIGSDFEYYTGNDEMIEFADDSTFYFRPQYKGLGMTVGFLHSLSPKFQYGASIQLPTTLSVADQFTYSNHIETDESFSDTWHYKAIRPLILHIGTGYFEKHYNVFYEATWSDWRNLEFSSEEIFENDLELPASVIINQEIRKTLHPTLSHHLGIALHLPILPIHIYAGYQYLPVAFSNIYNSDARQSYSTGFSYMIQENFSIQASYVQYFWKYENEPENFDKLSVGIAMHY